MQNTHQQKENQEFSVSFERINGHPGSIKVERKNLRSVLFGILSSGGKITSNKKA